MLAKMNNLTFLELNSAGFIVWYKVFLFDIKINSPIFFTKNTYLKLQVL